MEKYQGLLDHYKIPIGITLIGLVLICGGLLFTPKSVKQYPKESLVVTDSNKFKVNISGAVTKPGVYELSADSRVQDVVNAAGGVTADANKEYLDQYLNLAQKISDGIKIYIPFNQQYTLTVSDSINNSVLPNSQAQINLNTSIQSQLEALAGIGPSTASKIIANRPYQQLEDVVTKKALSKSLFEKLKGQLTVY